MCVLGHVTTLLVSTAKYNMGRHVLLLEDARSFTIVSDTTSIYLSTQILTGHAGHARRPNLLQPLDSVRQAFHPLSLQPHFPPHEWLVHAHSMDDFGLCRLVRDTSRVRIRITMHTDTQFVERGRAGGDSGLSQFQGWYVAKFL
jgi:hypothetical protein